MIDQWLPADNTGIAAPLTRLVRPLEKHEENEKCHWEPPQQIQHPPDKNPSALGLSARRFKPATLTTGQPWQTVISRNLTQHQL